MRYCSVFQRGCWGINVTVSSRNKSRQARWKARNLGADGHLTAISLRMHGSSSRGAELLYPRHKASQQLWQTWGDRRQEEEEVCCLSYLSCCRHKMYWGRGFILVPGSVVRKAWQQSCEGWPRCIPSQEAESDVTSGSPIQSWIPACGMVPPIAHVALELSEPNLGNPSQLCSEACLLCAWF